MMAEDEDALFCDLAETYHILDFRTLPVETVARLAAGLKADSRIKMRLAGVEPPSVTGLLAAAVDALNFLAWAKTKDAAKGRNRPKPVLKAVKMDRAAGFGSAADFEAARSGILGAGNE